MEDEIFGPILPILTYENLGEAVHKNSSIAKTARSIYVY